jgi:hypothetical protein
VPQSQQLGPVKVTATFDSGPLAGTLHAETTLQVVKGKNQGE